MVEADRDGRRPRPARSDRSPGRPPRSGSRPARTSTSTGSRRSSPTRRQTVVNRNRIGDDLRLADPGWPRGGRSCSPGSTSAAATLLHLPAETFVEYQLDAQAVRPDRSLATAAYGDGGPWYIPLKRSFAEGGYEPSVANVSPETEPAYRQAIRDLLTS